MSNRLSNSACNKFISCPKSYEYHYLRKIRPTIFRSSLLFGSALDKAIGTLLDPKDEFRTPEEVFQDTWTSQELNGKTVQLSDCRNLVYAKSDYDKDLVDQSELDVIGVTKEEAQNAIDRRDDIGYANLYDEDQIIVNKVSWLSLRRKGLLMLKAFREKVLPKLTKIYSTQEFIELENEDGDTVVGYLDIVADVEGYDTPIVLDVKTSAMKYDEKDSVIFSTQLTLYVHAVCEKYNTRKAGFIVLNKSIIKNKTKICSKCNYDGSGGRSKTCDKEELVWIENKKGIKIEKSERCNGKWIETINPEVYVQFIVDEIPEATENIVMENIQNINQAIKTNNFTRNLSNCSNIYGSPCEYIKLCYYDNMDGLEVQVKK